VVPNPPKELQASKYTHILLAQTKQCNITIFPIYFYWYHKNTNPNYQTKLINLTAAPTKPN
jgi:hypothetical protein